MGYGVEPRDATQSGAYRPRRFAGRFRSDQEKTSNEAPASRLEALSLAVYPCGTTFVARAIAIPLVAYGEGELLRGFPSDSTNSFTGGAGSGLGSSHAVGPSDFSVVGGRRCGVRSWC